MSHEIPQRHPLRRLFRGALDRAFQEQPDLYSPHVASHLQDGVLCDFVHVDRIYRLRDAAGRNVQQLPEMLPISGRKEGPERRLEVDRYIGDFVLFLLAFFPTTIRRGHWLAPEAMVSRVGQLLVRFEQPADYYKAEGRNAYSRAAETARLFDPLSRATFEQLSEDFEGYLDVLARVRRILWEREELREIDGALGAED